MSWGISPKATEKEKIFADYNDSLMGMNSADGLSYRHYSKIYDIGRELADKEYQQGREDTIKELEIPMIPKEFIREQYLRGAREFAEWLANGCAFMRRLGEDDMYTVDELISKWQKNKGEEYGKI